METLIDVFAAESMVQLGYDREQIVQSLEMERYDETWAAYHLLQLPLYAVRKKTNLSSIVSIARRLHILKVHGHGQTHWRNFCRFKLDI